MFRIVYLACFKQNEYQHKNTSKTRFKAHQLDNEGWSFRTIEQEHLQTSKQK